MSQKKWCIAISNSPVVFDDKIFLCRIVSNGRSSDDDYDDFEYSIFKAHFENFQDYLDSHLINEMESSSRAFK